jgi:UDP-N-acetylglucosamine 4,6-dehydratase
MLNDKAILITGGTGTLGRKIVATLLEHHKPRKVIVYSRDEQKHFEMNQQFPENEGNRVLRYFIGDVRDKDRLYRALDGVDIVIHAAAMKHVHIGEYNPMEVIKTNVLGSANIIDAAIDRNVEKVIALSTDKAANPINLYGAAKLCADKLFTAANSYSGYHDTRFSVVRYGNVSGSKGSVVPFFLKARNRGVLPITDPRMTRFWITLQQGVDFVLQSLERTLGGEIFVPKIPSVRIVDIAKAVDPDCRTEIVGIRPGEKLHEVMVPADDARHTIEHTDYFTILPQFPEFNEAVYKNQNGGRPCTDGFCYSSDTNQDWLSIEDLRVIVEECEHSIGARNGNAQSNLRYSAPTRVAANGS